MRSMFVFFGFLLAAGTAHAEWYEGGNLHSASADEWASASFDNKIATSADFVFIALGSRRVSAMGGKKQSDGFAADIMICIDNAIYGLEPKSIKRMTVSELASACVVLMEPEWGQKSSFD